MAQNGENIRADEIREQVDKIRAAYPHLEERTILLFAEQAVKNKHKNEREEPTTGCKVQHD